jgi:hypothetical protein
MARAVMSVIAAVLFLSATFDNAAAAKVPSS